MSDRLSRYLGPRFWPTWLGLGLLRLLSQLPYPVLMWLGYRVGDLLHLLLPGRRQVARTNIGRALPDLPDREQARLVRESFRAAGASLFESGLAWWANEDRLAPLARVHGLEHLEGALAGGKGAILLSAHMTDLEIGGRLLALHHPFQVMYKQARNPLFETVMTRSRERHYLGAVQRHDARGMVKGLKQNRACWYAPDQDFGRKGAVFVPFFGIATATVTATARFARMAGAPVVPFVPVRRDDGRGYDLFLEPAWEGYPSGDDQADAARVNQTIEAWVRRTPAQYLWLHKRFKTRPEGEASFY